MPEYPPSAMDSAYAAHWNDSILTEDDSHPAFALSATDDGHCCLSPELIELIVNICDELSLSPEVEFTCLDNFDVYCRRRHADILEMVAAAGNRSVMSAALNGGSYSSNGANNNVTSSAGATSAANSCNHSVIVPSLASPNRHMMEVWQRENESFVNDAPIRLVAVLLLSAKMIGNGALRSIKLRTIVGMLRALRPLLTEMDMKVAEYEVFHTLKHVIKPSTMFRSLDLLLGHSERLASGPADMAYIRSKALNILRIVYITRDRIFAVFAERMSRLDVAIVREQLTDRQRRLCLVAGIVVCAFLFADQSAARYTRLALRLADVSGLPVRQLSQMTEVITQVVQTDGAGDYLCHSLSSPPPTPNSTEASEYMSAALAASEKKSAATAVGRRD